MSTFVSAFRAPAFRYYWLYMLAVYIGGIVDSEFVFYWYEDCFPHGYNFFGWHMASTAQSALSIKGRLYGPECHHL